MEFKIYRANKLGTIGTREIKTIEDLMQVSFDYHDGKFGTPEKIAVVPFVELVVSFGDGIEWDNSITIYDGYLE